MAAIVTDDYTTSGVIDLTTSGVVTSGGDSPGKETSQPLRRRSSFREILQEIVAPTPSKNGEATYIKQESDFVAPDTPASPNVARVGALFDGSSSEEPREQPYWW
jgi:hypothetical protein